VLQCDIGISKLEREAMTKRKPKVEILFEISLSGERTKECDLVEYLEEVRETTKAYPEAEAITIEVPEVESIFGEPVTYYAIYRKLPDAKRVTDKDIRLAIKELVED
jgi:hypothetical protein